MLTYPVYHTLLYVVALECFDDLVLFYARLVASAENGGKSAGRWTDPLRLCPRSVLRQDCHCHRDIERSCEGGKMRR